MQSYSARCGKQLYSTEPASAECREAIPAAGSFQHETPAAAAAAAVGRRHEEFRLPAEPTPPRPRGAPAPSGGDVPLPDGRRGRARRRRRCWRAPAPAPAPPPPEDARAGRATTHAPATVAATTTAPPVTTPVVVMHNACVERHLVPAHQERPEPRRRAARRAECGETAPGRRRGRLGRRREREWRRRHRGDPARALGATPPLEATGARDLAFDARAGSAGGDTMGCGGRCWPRARPSLLVQRPARAAGRVPRRRVFARPPGYHAAPTGRRRRAEPGLLPAELRRRRGVEASEASPR